MIRKLTMVGTGALTAIVLLAVGVTSAFAASAWRIDSISNTTAAPGGTFAYYVQLTNVGGADIEGAAETISFSGSLPNGIAAVAVKKFDAGEAGANLDCSANGFPTPASNFTCTDSVDVVPTHASGETAYITLEVQATVSPEVLGGGEATFSVSGGGSPAASTVDPTLVTPIVPGFGFDAFDGQAADASGDTFTQAGGHPASVSTSIDFNTVHNSLPFHGDLWPAAPPKDIFVDLPPGLVGNPAGLARCTAPQLSSSVNVLSRPLCPPASQVGTVFVRFNGTFTNPYAYGPMPLYDMVPPPNVPARFGFNVFGTVVTLDATVRNGSDYGLTVVARNIGEGIDVAGTTTTFWDVPSDASHDSERACPGHNAPFLGGPTCSSGAQATAFLRNPTSCTAPGQGLRWTAQGDSWSNPGQLDPNGEPVAGDANWQTAEFVTHEVPGYPAPPAGRGPQVGITGCEKEPFTPSIQVQPTSNAADSPTGLKVTLAMPQQALEDPSAVSQADLRKTVVRLPEGMTIDPSQADGLAACSAAQIGYLGNGFAAPYKIHFASSEQSCPDASKIGSLEVETPLLEKPLQGSVYLAAQNENPFGSLLAIYLVAKGQGVTIKLAGHIETDPATGRVTTALDVLPQTPISKVTLQLDSGARSPLMNPATCGQKAVESTLEGWNGKTVTISQPYDVECTPGLGGFNPSFTSGATSPRAGAFSPFALSISRNDGEQRFAGLTGTLPRGVAAILRGVPLCADADAKAGTCSAASRIGSVTVGAGGGSNPFFLKGSVYLTGPYNGGPFGFVVVVPAVAGPFNLGNVIVRGSIRIDPATAQATVVSDPLPQFVNQTGIPADVRRVDVTLDRPGFTFNPTDCEPLSVNGTLSSAQGTSVPVSSRFQAVNCATLPFHPSFKVSTIAKTSRKNGAFLHVVVQSGSGQANIHSVHVVLPKALPSRLPTLQLACPDSVFDANPAACGAGARIGTATARTPILAGALSGPVYFVSHGGAKFPDLVVVLQGEGITVELTGHTLINGNVTSSTFATVPDVPVTRFDLTLPQGPHSVLAAVRPLCKTKLVMPTRIVGQNGAVVNQSTKVAVSGCPKAKKHK